jgi:hypothetical protein
MAARAANHDHRPMHRTYPVAVPIDTNRGPGQTRRVGPTSMTFVTAALFETGDPLRFSMSLRGTGASPLYVVGDGSVRSVINEGELFIVDASIDRTRIALE